MKVKEIVEKTEKYEDLGALISNIETALANIEKTYTKQDNVTFIGGGLTFFGGLTPDEEREERVDVTLSADVNELIRDDMKALLKKHLKALKAEQEALEV